MRVRASCLPARTPRSRSVAIRLRREELGLEQQTVALDAGVERSWISHLESGRQNPAWGTVDRIARSDGRSLIDWLVEHDAAQAVIGVESPGSYGRCLVTALAGAGFEVLQVPAWRTHRERHRRGPGKTDPGDAISIAHVVRTKRADLGPAEEPELVRALGMLELQRRRFVRDRTQAIQRLRADWTQHDPVAEAGVIRCDRQRELNKLKRLQLGSSFAARTAARCIRELARDIADLNTRVAELDREIAQLLEEHDNPLADLHGAGANLAATIIAQAGDVRQFRNASAFARFCGAAPIPCGSGQTANRHRLHRGGNRQLNAALYPIAVVQQRH